MIKVYLRSTSGNYTPATAVKNIYENQTLKLQMYNFFSIFPVMALTLNL